MAEKNLGQTRKAWKIGIISFKPEYYYFGDTMLFTKKVPFSITEAQIKEDILSPENVILVKLNLRYPQFNCPKGDPLLKNAKPLYENIINNLAEFAKTELSKSALAEYKADDKSFRPFAAVTQWEVTEDTKDILSIHLTISIGDGKNPPSITEKSQIWDRHTGNLITVKKKTAS